MTNRKLFLLIGTSLPFIPCLTFAQCVATQDCKTLGYTETSCNGGKGVKCPFGNWWACLTSEEECLNLACDKLGFTYTCSGAGEKGVGNDCNGKYQGCTCDSSYKYTCSGTGYSGGSGTACGGKYTSCTCSSGYEWKNGSCQQVMSDGAHGQLYYCNGNVVGVRAVGMTFYVAMQDIQKSPWTTSKDICENYTFCGNLKGLLPSKAQLITIYQYKAEVNNLLTSYGGTTLSQDNYWSSTEWSNFQSSGVEIVSMATGNTTGTGYYYGPFYARPILASW